MIKCFVCDNKKIEKVFTNTRGVKHYYCKSCAKKYLIKLPKKCRKHDNNEKEQKKKHDKNN